MREDKRELSMSAGAEVAIGLTVQEGLLQTVHQDAGISKEGRFGF